MRLDKTYFFVVGLVMVNVWKYGFFFFLQESVVFSESDKKLTADAEVQKSVNNYFKAKDLFKALVCQDKKHH